MRPHWALAVRGAATTCVVALPAAGLLAYYRGFEEAGSFLYGVGVGLAVFAAIAATVSLITVRPTGGKILLGAGVYAGRFLFAAGAVGIPVYLEYLPMMPMVFGFVGVYVVENVALLWGAWKTGSRGISRRPRAERRFEA